MRSRVDDPGLVNAGDVEDAVEQHELYALTMAAADTDE